jgi:hypothetical protein
MHRLTSFARRLHAWPASWPILTILAIGGIAITLRAIPADTQAPPGHVSGTRSSAPAAISLNRQNWSDSAGHGSIAPSWYKNGADVVYLRGAARQTSPAGGSADLIGTLPATARPRANVFTVVRISNGTRADLEIARDGQITLISQRPAAARDDALVSLDGIGYAKASART